MIRLAPFITSRGPILRFQLGCHNPSFRFRSSQIQSFFNLSMLRYSIGLVHIYLWEGGWIDGFFCSPTFSLGKNHLIWVATTRYTGGSRHPHHAGAFHRIAFYVVEAVEATRGLRGLELHGNEGNVPPKNRTKIEKSWNCGEPNVGNWATIRSVNRYNLPGSICLKFPLRMNWLLRIHFKAPVEKTKRFLFLGGMYVWLYDYLCFLVILGPHYFVWVI